MSVAHYTKRTEKLQLMVNDEELQVIEDWRFANRMPTRSAAIRELVRRGLGTREKQANVTNGSAPALSVIE